MRASATSVLAALGCTAGGDITGSDASGTSFEAPDIAGSYEVVLDASVDSDEVAWFPGALEIRGAAQALTWDFGEETMEGAVDEAFAFDFAGQTGAGVAVSGGGTVFLDGGAWALDGDVAFSGTPAGDLGGAFTGAQVLP
jgi:hypothetical protein